ncbi:MAG: TIGR03842 family LLM class F420-dependent oxidoreductase, partial [Alphaproteobacteria bacterium]|nr:TIGR03842 family LLM class F420-dependent oxidoreductase [Alphaproteobacteria bacterium]
NYRVMSAAPAFFGDRQTCREATRWFPAMVGNHVADIVERYGTGREDIPPSLTAYIEGRRGYDYSRHGQSDNPFLDFITDDVIDGFSVLGTPEEHVAKLEELQAAGVTQFYIYLDNGDEEEIIAEYGRSIIPAFRLAAGLSA